MRLNEVSNGIRESWKSEEKLTNKNQEGELQVNSGGHGALPETYKLKVNQKVIHDSIRSMIPSETLIMHEPCIADFFVNGESAGVVDNTKILEDWLMHIDCLLEKAECEKSKNDGNFFI
jgi:ribosomal protein L4